MILLEDLARWAPLLNALLIPIAIGVFNMRISLERHATDLEAHKLVDDTRFKVVDNFVLSVGAELRSVRAAAADDRSDIAVLKERTSG